MTDIKRMSVKEFRRLGYLQEINRIILHPLGLALEVIVDKETGEEKFGGVWDYREDPEGIRYSEDDAQSDEFQKKAERIAVLFNIRAPVRQEALGYVVQPCADKLAPYLNKILKRQAGQASE